MSADQRAELLPCPWCGRPASIIGDWNMERLVCSDRMGECPGATVDLPCHRPERRYASIDAWNRRTPDSAPAAPAVTTDDFDAWWLATAFRDGPTASPGWTVRDIARAAYRAAITREAASGEKGKNDE